MARLRLRRYTGHKEQEGATDEFGHDAGSDSDGEGAPASDDEVRGTGGKLHRGTATHDMSHVSLRCCQAQTDSEWEDAVSDGLVTSGRLGGESPGSGTARAVFTSQGATYSPSPRSYSRPKDDNTAAKNALWRMLRRGLRARHDASTLISAAFTHPRLQSMTDAVLAYVNVGLVQQAVGGRRRVPLNFVPHPLRPTCFLSTTASGGDSCGRL